MEIAAIIVLGLLGGLLGEIPIPGNCVFEFTCLPDNPLDVFKLYHEVYGIPNTVVLGLLLGIIEAAIYLRNRSTTMMAILGIYTVAALGATYAAEAQADGIGPQLTLTYYVIALGIASAVVVFFMKVIRE